MSINTLTSRSGTSTFVVLQLSPRRWAVAEQCGLFLANHEYRVVTRPFNNRVDAHTVCSELATRSPEDLSPLARECLLDVNAFRGNCYLRSHLLRSLDN